MAHAKAEHARDGGPSTAESLREYGRGFAGGLLFSIPLLYTMEVWWASFMASPARLLVLLGFTYLLLLGYNRYAGLRHDATWIEVAIDSVEELGLGIVTSAAVLYLIGQIGTGESASETLGKIVVEATVVAVGFSVGSAQLGAGESGLGDEDSLKRASGLVNQVVIAFCGAVLLAANVAPTEEIVMIAVESTVWRLLAIGALSVLLVGGVLHYIGFKGSDRYARQTAHLGVVTGTAITYAIALTASALLLWFFGRLDDVSAGVAAAQTVVLALPSALGAAAGRLLLQR